jgi:hypothetical protein
VARYETRSKLRPDVILADAQAFFGDNLGLEQVVSLTNSLRWEGGGGTVSVSVSPDDSGRETVVELVTREWDEPVREFMHKIGGRA